MMDNELKKVLILSKKKEKQYCEKYEIELRRLANGMMIIAIPCGMDNAAWSEINFGFMVGAYGSPAGQVHFFEHFFNKKITQIAAFNGVSLNAYTSQLRIVEHAQDTTNPNVLDFGMWKILPLIPLFL